MLDNLPTVSVKGETVRIIVDPKIHELEAILTASYHYIDDFYVFLTHNRKTGCITAELTAKEKIAAVKLKKKAAEYSNILLAETLRLKINRNNKKFRETLLEKAIAGALSLPKTQTVTPVSSGDEDRRRETLELDEELKRIIEKVKNMDYRNDPLGIAVPVTDGGRKKKGGSARPKKKA